MSGSLRRKEVEMANPAAHVHFISCPECGSALDAYLQCPGCKKHSSSFEFQQKIEEWQSLFDLPNYPSEYWAWKKFCRRRMWL